MKNEKWIVFPESRYVNSNPANLSKNYLVTITHSPLKTSPYVQCNFIAEDMKYLNILQIIIIQIVLFSEVPHLCTGLVH